jgi:hypothetical protein
MDGDYTPPTPPAPPDRDLAELTDAMVDAVRVPALLTKDDVSWPGRRAANACTCEAPFPIDDIHLKACPHWKPRGECVSLNADGSLDEVVLHGVDVHIEQMSDHNWFVGLYRPGTDGDRIRLGFHSKRKVKAFWEFEGLEVEVLQEQETPDGWKVLPVDRNR